MNKITEWIVCGLFGLGMGLLFGWLAIWSNAI